MLMRLISHLEEGFMALLLALTVWITFSQVVARYIFATGFSWALELTTYLFAWMVLFGISHGIKVGSHIGIDILVRQFPHRLRRIIGLMAILCCCVYCIILLIGATGYVYKLYDLGIEAQDLPIPRWIPFIMLPMGLFLALVRLLQAGWRTLTGRQEGLCLADEARDALDAVDRVEVVEIVEVLQPVPAPASCQENQQEHSP